MELLPRGDCFMELQPQKLGKLLTPWRSQKLRQPADPEEIDGEWQPAEPEENHEEALTNFNLSSLAIE
jgi:hypothetical protein